MRVFVVIAALMALPASGWAQPGVVGAAGVKKKGEDGKTEEPHLNPIRGSRVSFQNSMTGNTLNRGALPEYEPFYAMSLSLAPQYWFGEQFYVRSNLVVTADLSSAFKDGQGDGADERISVNRGDTNEADLTRVSLNDLSLMAGMAPVYVIPVVDVRISAEAGLSFPTSEFSRAESRRLRTQAMVSLSRSFPVLSGLNVTAVFRGGKNFHGSQTGVSEGALGSTRQQGLQTGSALRATASAGAGSGAGAALEIGSGLRNFSGSASTVAVVSQSFLDNLSATLVYGNIYGFVYPGLEESALISNDPTASSPDSRYFSTSQLAVTYMPTAGVWVSGGLSSFHPMRQPGGAFYAPFINRFTQGFVEVGVSLGQFISL